MKRLIVTAILALAACGVAPERAVEIHRNVHVTTYVDTDGNVVGTRRTTTTTVVRVGQE